MGEKIKVVTAPVRIDISGGWPDSDPYRKDFGGAVLNAAVNLRVSASFERHSLGKVPHSSGLGTSGAIRAAYLVAANNELIEDKLDLIKRVHILENQVMGQRAGFQDQAAAIYGGVNYWEFYGNGAIRRTGIEREQTQHLEDRLVLIYTGQGHLSSNIHDLVFGKENYGKNILRIDRMKAIAGEMKANLTDEQTMAGLINETWDIQKGLHESIETDTMIKIQEDLKGYYLATRATGAGGGGCMIFYTDKKDDLIGLAKELEGEIKGMNVIPFRFDYCGIEIHESND